jgi:predicted permease
MSAQEFWTPFLVTPEKVSWGRFLLVAARLRPGATLADANRDVEAIHAQLRVDKAVTEGWDAQVIAMSDEIGRAVRPSLVALVVACALLLLMVLTNTSLLAIADGRRRAADRALRGVLGATTARLAREGAITALLLAGAGALLAMLLSAWAIPTLTRYLPPNVPRLDSVHFGPVTLAVAAATGLVALVVLALVPAKGTAGATQGFQQAGTRLTHRRHGGWVMIAEAATAVILVLFAGLTLRSFDRLAAVDMGFDPSHLMAFRIALETPGVPNVRAAASSREFLAELRASPGVVAAGRTTVRPLYEGGTATSIARAGEAAIDPSTQPIADVRLVDDGFFRAMGVIAKSGRVFAADEPAGGTLHAVVSEAFVRALWPGESDVLGRRFDLNVDGGLHPEIVGVVRDLHLFNPRSAPRPAVYLSTEQKSWGEEFDVLVRTTGDPSDILPQVRDVARSVAPAAPIYRVESMQKSSDDVVARERVTAQLLAFFGSAALLLVAVGVYGLYSGEVTGRRREIGVRMALGETAGAVVRSLLGRALLGAVVGVAAGLGIGVLLTRVLTSVLFGVAPTDTLTYAGAAAVVMLTALAATTVPARQASTVSPGEALRE